MSRHTLKWTLEDFHTESSVEEKVQNANELAEIIQEQTGDNQRVLDTVSGLNELRGALLESETEDPAVATLTNVAINMAVAGTGVSAEKFLPINKKAFDKKLAIEMIGSKITPAIASVLEAVEETQKNTQAFLLKSSNFIEDYYNQIEETEHFVEEQIRRGFVELPYMPAQYAASGLMDKVDFKSLLDGVKGTNEVLKNVYAAALSSYNFIADEVNPTLPEDTIWMYEDEQAKTRFEQIVEPLHMQVEKAYGVMSKNFSQEVQDGLKTATSQKMLGGLYFTASFDSIESHGDREESSYVNGIKSLTFQSDFDETFDSSVVQEYHEISAQEAKDFIDSIEESIDIFKVSVKNAQQAFFIVSNKFETISKNYLQSPIASMSQEQEYSESVIILANLLHSLFTYATNCLVMPIRAHSEMLSSLMKVVEGFKNQKWA